MKNTFLRLLLSIYHYHKHNEKWEFLDAWWQFYHTLTYLVAILLMGIVSIIMGLLGIRNTWISISPFLVSLGIDLFVKEFRWSKFHDFIVTEYKTVKPIPLWHLLIIALIAILFLILSLNFCYG